MRFAIINRYHEGASCGDGFAFDGAHADCVARVMSGGRKYEVAERVRCICCAT